MRQRKRWRKAVMREGSPIDKLAIRQGHDKWLEDSEKIITAKNLYGKLDLSNWGDRYLFKSYLAIRLIRLEIYNRSLFLTNPYNQIVAKKYRFFGNFYRKFQSIYDYYNENRDALEQETKRFVDSEYRGSEDKEDVTARAKAIEFCANDLFALSTQGIRRGYTRFKLTGEVKSQWIQKWGKRFS